MFEDSCIVCGRPLLDDSRAFCSDECRSQDATEYSSSDCEVPPLSSRYSCYSVSSSDDDDDELSSLSSPSRSPSSVAIVTDEDLALPSRLSYARRPSGTNNPSIQKSLPVSRSVPTTTLSIISDSEDDIPTVTATATITTKSKRTRNRASLPAYFSLLQTQQYQHQPYPQQQHSQQQPIASTSSTSSPSTPKLSLTALTAALPTLPISPSRRRLSFGYGYSNNSCSRSSSPPHPLIPDSRGRPSVRRNSSPPPKFNKFRGRLRADELDGKGGVMAPGYGNGRSGLLDRGARR